MLIKINAAIRICYYWFVTREWNTILFNVTTLAIKSYFCNFDSNKSNNLTINATTISSNEIAQNTNISLNIVDNIIQGLYKSKIIVRSKTNKNIYK